MSIPGMSRPARTAGLALLAIAAISAVVGGIMLATGDGGGRVAEPSQSSAPGGGTPPPGGANSGAPSRPGESASSRAPTSEAPGTGESTAPGGGAPTSRPGEPGAGGTGGANGGTEDKPGETDVAVRVYNNSNVEDLASRAARDLRGQGWAVAEVSNYSRGMIPTTTAYYRKGTPERDAAMSLAAEFGMRAEPRFDGISDASAGIIIIVTKDYKGPVGKSG